MPVFVKASRRARAYTRSSISKMRKAAVLFSKMDRRSKSVQHTTLDRTKLRRGLLKAIITNANQSIALKQERHYTVKGKRERTLYRKGKITGRTLDRHPSRSIYR